MGAAVAVADFDRDGWQDFYVTNSEEGSRNRLYPQPRRRHVRGRRRAAGRRRRQPRRHRRLDGRGLGRLRQRRLRGSVPLQLGPARAVSQRAAARRFTRVTRARRACRRGSTSTAPSGSTTTATAGSICSSAATGRNASISGSSPTRRSCRRASSTRTTAAGSTCSTISATGRSRKCSERVGLDVAPLDARGGRRRSARHRLSRSLPRQRLRRLGALRQRRRHAFARSDARPASATRRRAA